MAAKEGVYSDSYFSAAGEHLVCARILYNNGRYALCHYLAGLAVECHLRSIIAKKKLEFDEHHDLKKLAKACSYLDLVSKNHAAKVSKAFSVIVARWRNNHRSRSEDALRRFLKLHGLDRGIKGDFLKTSSATMINAAYELINRGE